MQPAELEAWRFLSEAPRYGTAEEAEAHFARAIGAYGYQRYSCMLAKTKSFIKEPETLAQREFAPWDQHYWSSRYFAGDPCAGALRAYRAPFSWSDARSSNPGAIEQAMWGDASALHMNDGFVVRIFAPDGQQLVVRMATEAPDTDPAIRPVLESLATVFGTLMLRFWEGREDALGEDVITRREAQCLHWVSRGKTDWEIARILGISPRTAHHHVENAKRKLGAGTRVLAATKAGELGLLDRLWADQPMS